MRFRARWASALIGAALRSSALPLGLVAASLALLVPFLGVDPASGVTVSNSPFTDEGWSALNGRNVVLLGAFSLDDWNLHLVDLPFSLLQALSFGLLGTGIEQGRLVSVLCTAGTVGLLAFGLRSVLGARGAAFAALAFGTCWLVLYQGRLILIEPLVTLFLTAGFVAALNINPARWLRAGLVTGLWLALAIGTKPSAVAAAAGLLAGSSLARLSVDGRARWLAAALGVIAAGGIGWALVLGLPNRDQLAVVFRIWPEQTLPGTVGEAAGRIARYLTRSDGVLPWILPLFGVAAAGVGFALARWRALEARRRVLLLAAVGWFLAGLAFLLVVPYRPNRYFEPLVPPLTILAGLALDEGRERFAARSSPSAVRLAGLALVAVVAVPGLVAYASWMASAAQTLPALQDRVRGLLPPRAAVAGPYAPTFAMTAPVQAVVSFPERGVNAGDQYRERGVRWVWTVDGVPPAFVDLHPEAWAARREVLCAPWGENLHCLYELP